MLGSKAINNTNTKLPIPTILIDKSLSVLATSVTAAPSFFKEPILPLKEEMIVGMVLNKVMKPPAATAPAPICLI